MRTQLAAESGGSVAIAAGTRPRVALAHDWLVGMRGGERVLDAITRMCADRFEIVGLFTMFDDGRPLSPAIDAIPKFTSLLNRLPGAMRRWLLPMYPLAVGQLARRLAAEHARKPIDLVISTSSAAIKGLRPPVGVPHICYCHSPARYLWSQSEQYRQGNGGTLRSIGLRAFGGWLRGWDKRTADHVTEFVANSTHIKQEIARCYGRVATVVHPPVRTEYFTPLDVRSHLQIRDKCWLYVGALEPYKRVDLVLRAASAANSHLAIVGTGTQESSLRDLAKRLQSRDTQIHFLGRASDGELRSHLRQDCVLVFPQIEDFGIVAVEAQACGMPVVAFRAGGALDSVIPNRTGVFFDTPTPEAIAEAVRRCLELGDTTDACRASAERFSEANFERAMLRVIEEAMAGR